MRPENYWSIWCENYSRRLYRAGLHAHDRHDCTVHAGMRCTRIAVAAGGCLLLREIDYQGGGIMNDMGMGCNRIRGVYQ
eukprot:COSAG01_NODE_25199_length_752_cov_2.629403_1_plen_79_part_00